MKLFIFAHRKEAQHFIDQMHFRPLAFYFDGVFENDHHKLLITGEGLSLALMKTSALLSHYANEIKEVVNLGVAGSLCPQIKIDTIISVRTAYAEKSTEGELDFEFKSFTSHAQKSNSPIDCISLQKRAMTTSAKIKLTPIAQIVDRELWGIAMASGLFKRPYYAYKYISDDLDSTDFCQLVIEKAPLISQALYEYYLQYHEKNIPTNLLPNAEEIPAWALDPAFYFTVTQKRNLKHCLDTLFVKKVLVNEERINEIKLLPHTPKERTRELLDYLHFLINPMALKIDYALKKATYPLRQHHIQVTFDRNLEKKELHLQFTVANEVELKEKCIQLAAFNFEKIDHIFEGQFNV